MRVVFSVLFVCVLLVPAVVLVSGYDPGINVDHLGIDAPLFTKEAIFDNEYYLALDQYFNDSFTLRAPLVIAKNFIDYHLFRTTDSRDVHIGSNGWLYTRKSIRDYRKEACDHRARAEQLALELYTVEKLIEESGRRFFFAVAPNKSTIYPEFVGFMPRGNLCNSSLYDLFLESISAYPLTSFVRLDERLMLAKKTHPLLYDKSSIYWNSLGAKIAGRTLLENFSSGKPQERTESLALLGLNGSDDLRSSLLNIAVPREEKQFQHFVAPDLSDRPSALIYCDSSISNLLPHMAGMFKRMEVIQSDQIPSKQYGEELNAYDLILFVVAESEMDTIGFDLDQIFMALKAGELDYESYRLNLEKVVAVSLVSLAAGAHGLIIKSVGSESIFEIQSLASSNNAVFRLLRLSVEYPRPDTMTIEYLPGQPTIIRKNIKPGPREIYVPLPFAESITLRIKPGRNADLFTLRSAELLNFPRTSDSTKPKPEKPALASTDYSQQNMLIRKPIKAADTGSSLQSRPPAVDQKKETAAKGSEETARSVVEKPILEEPSILVTDYEDGRIFQRRGRSADIVVSGTYTGAPTAIEARVIRQGRSDEIVPWTVIDSSPKSGIFLGVLKNVPQGGWYSIQVRHSGNHAVSSLGSNRWGVGILVACIGQSNMKEWFHIGTSFRAHTLLRKQDGEGWAQLGSKGNAAIAFGNRLIERLGVPVGLLDYSVNGSGLRKEADFGEGYWEDTSPGSIYNQFLAGVSAVGGFVEFVIWMQGEADAAWGTVTEEEYRSSLNNFITNQLRADIGNGSDEPKLPFLIISMIKRPGGKDKPHQAIREAQQYVARNVDDCYLAATTLDLKNQGRQHLAPSAYTVLGYRVSQTILYILGEENYYRGPSVAGVSQVDRWSIDVTLRHRGGTDFTPTSGISGWQVLVQGNPVPILEAFRQDEKTIRITLKQPILNRTTVRYLYGALPDVTNPVLDNSALSLPLEEYHQQ
jgi:hypothetical protein